MQLKSLAAAAVLACSAAAAAASPITLTLDPFTGDLAGTFSGTGATESFTFSAVAGSSLDLASLTSTYAYLTSNPSHIVGYHITSILFDGNDIATIPGDAYLSQPSSGTRGNLTNSNDAFSFNINGLSGGTHTITVNGVSNTSPSYHGFTGNILVSAVPEPATYGMLLGGLGLLALVRRKGQS